MSTTRCGEEHSDPYGPWCDRPQGHKGLHAAGHGRFGDLPDDEWLWWGFAPKPDDAS